MFGLPDQAIGAILASIIAGTIALLGLIISKEQKVSEFRQQWIDGLRADIAAVIRYGHCMCRHTLAAQMGQAISSASVSEDFAGITEASARIRLRLNRKEKESATLLAALDQHLVMVKTESDTEVVSSVTDKLVAAAEVVLKQEWVRVRSGEPVYRIARWAALLVIVALVAALLYHVFKK
jgi:hypothetical protein